ncbi:FHA domain-containing protein [Caenorhabditis elegans]|uniref:FHA domain-containing protein n=1 Tax=Caenorhabditis elegans TaxID=6239 RepID=U4PR75_CAEEL|nr:FHA domain-containing protein [Caenorhabditis elegans]CDH93063.1 FHA domain-containing protein [Caenorhabditis elegans]|eukprot:NP_001294341.1 Uncharacterized protein CELE_M4.1 [Caenorhabditis elegans]
MSFGWVSLVATPKSHPFEERRIKVNGSNDPVKIGRAVARIQATAENAVFDCKVLSRNHAILWFRDGEFWLKDTKSSNGTFVNNEKLQQTVSGRDTDVRRVFSGDIIQLGVEIVENANKVVYGCIYAVINCFNADGKLMENTGPASEEGQRTTTTTLVSNRKLFQMQQYISEAQHREKQREDKLTELMSIIAANEQAAETAWKALVNEDRLLARIESLEAQLSILSSNNNNPDKQKEELLKMIDEKTKFEAKTKEMIRRLIEENGETTSRLKDMERSLETTEQTYQQLRSRNEDLETALAETTEMFDAKAAELEQATADLIEKQKVVTTYEEKLTDLQQKNLKLSKSCVINETASGLSRLLANSINSGSFIDEPELHLLISTLKSASYLPPHTRETTSSSNDNSSASDSAELHTQLINGFAQSSESSEESEEKKKKPQQQDDKTTIEAYLKTILELQAKNRELEMTAAMATMPEVQENHGCLEASSLKETLEFSPSGNVSFFPPSESANLSGSSTSTSSQAPLWQKQATMVMKKPDELENLLLLVSLVPLLAFLLSAIAPIQKRFSSGSSPQVKKEE